MQSEIESFKQVFKLGDFKINSCIVKNMDDSFTNRCTSQLLSQIMNNFHQIHVHVSVNEFILHLKSTLKFFELCWKLLMTYFNIIFILLIILVFMA